MYLLFDVFFVLDTSIRQVLSRAGKGGPLKVASSDLGLASWWLPKAYSWIALAGGGEIGLCHTSSPTDFPEVKTLAQRPFPHTKRLQRASRKGTKSLIADPLLEPIYKDVIYSLSQEPRTSIRPSNVNTERSV